MPQSGVSVSTQGANEFRALAKRLRQAGAEGKGLRTELRKNIAEAGKPAVEDVRHAVLAIPVTGHGGGSNQRSTVAALNAARAARSRQNQPLGRTKAGKPRKRATVREAAQRAARRDHGLRRTIASATRMQITPRGVKIVVASNRLPVDQRSLPRHLDSPKGWRHPRFGDKQHWYHQQGKPYFASVIKKHAPQVRAKVLQAMETIKKRLEG